MAKERILEIEELAAELVSRGGAIVSSSSCTAKEIEAARRDSRFACVDGLGFVLRLPRVQRKVARSARSGRFVSKSTARENPAETVNEEV